MINSGSILQGFESIKEINISLGRSCILGIFEKGLVLNAVQVPEFIRIFTIVSLSKSERFWEVENSI